MLFAGSVIAFACALLVDFRRSFSWHYYASGLAIVAACSCCVFCVVFRVCLAFFCLPFLPNFCVCFLAQFDYSRVCSPGWFPAYFFVALLCQWFGNCGCVFVLCFLCCFSCLSCVFVCLSFVIIVSCILHAVCLCLRVALWLVLRLIVFVGRIYVLNTCYFTNFGASETVRSCNGVAVYVCVLVRVYVFCVCDCDCVYDHLYACLCICVGVLCCTHALVFILCVCTCVIILIVSIFSG